MAETTDKKRDRNDEDKDKDKKDLNTKPKMAPQKQDDNKPNASNNVMLHVGMVVNGYEIQKLIGQGKFSYVFKAKNVENKKIVAMKLIKIFDMDNEKQRDSCLKEVQLHQSLDHNNIVKYLNWFIDNKLNELFIAVEWAEKGDLKLVIKRSQEEEVSFPEKQIWRYIHQIASAIQHMHKHRIMHRDLKPANIFIDNNGDLKIGDLGLSRQLSSQTFEAFSRVGTPLYMSPEVLQGKGYDWKSDVWSIGCIGYELCALRSPFRQSDKENLNLYELFQRISKGTFPPPPERYSAELRSLVVGMLKVDPDQRFDADQVVQLCETYKKHMANKPQIDTYLIMDDVIEKLSLLDYENQFCKGWKHKKISRVYYAHPPGDGEDELQRVHMLYDMIYWLISLNKDMVKKQGVFINFKDFKGKTVDALTKMINDLKKFGLPNVKNLKIENLRSGYGEVVCQLIDELVNMELYRREFEFGMPQIPDDDADEQSEQEDADDAKDEQFAGKNEIINGIEIQQHSMMSPGGFANDSSAKYRKQKSTLIGKAEETKINFFNPEQIGLYEMDKPEEDAIIEAQIDPLEWNKEIDRVYKDLVNIEKEIEILKKTGGDNTNDFEDCRRHLELIIEMCHDIKESSHYDVQKVFMHSGEELENQLAIIRKNEIRINNQNEKQITHLGEITKKKKAFAQELRHLITKVKEFDQQHRECQAQIIAAQNAYDEKAEDMGGQKQVKRIKEGLRELRSQLKDQKVHEGLMINSIFNFKNKMSHKGRNHLYDSIEEQIGEDEKEFTLDDLEHKQQPRAASRASSRDSVDNDFPVTTPTKLKPQVEDKLNPYTNPYLDADLSSTIGKVSKQKRKQINTNMFQIEQEPITQFQEDEVTTDTTRDRLSEQNRFSTQQKQSSSRQIPQKRSNSRSGFRSNDRAKEPQLPPKAARAPSADPDFE